MSVDLNLASGLIAEMNAIDERMADRGPILILPRPVGDAPNLPELRARLDEIQKRLRVKRNYKTAKGHDLDGAGNPFGFNLEVPGTIEEVKDGADRANPKATRLVKVGFDDGSHLWFSPDDLDMIP